jgi:hypothetical protein
VTFRKQLLESDFQKETFRKRLSESEFLESDFQKATSRKRLPESKLQKASSRKQVQESKFKTVTSRKRLPESEFQKANYKQTNKPCRVAMCKGGHSFKLQAENDAPLRSKTRQDPCCPAPAAAHNGVSPVKESHPSIATSCISRRYSKTYNWGKTLV